MKYQMGVSGMALKDIRDWISKLEAEGELKRITAKVDWNLELGEISRRAIAERGPALLFENIKDHFFFSYQSII